MTGQFFSAWQLRRAADHFLDVYKRQAERLVQCVYEEGVTNFDIHDLKEESAVEVLGTVKAEERAPHGFELRLEAVSYTHLDVYKRQPFNSATKEK